MSPIRCLTLAFALLAASAATATAGALQDIKARGSLICGVYATSEPYGFRDPKTREFTGYEVELCKQLADSLNVKFQPHEVSGPSRMPDLLQNRIDVLAGILSYSEERAKQVDFSNVYVDGSHKCMVLADSDLKSTKDLDGKRLALLKGSILEPIVPKMFPNASIITLDNGATAYLALQQGKVQAACWLSVLAALIEVRTKDGASKPIRFLPEALLAQKNGFALRKGDPEFVAYLNKFLNEFESSGRAEALYAKWMGDKSELKLPREFKAGTDVTK